MTLRDGACISNVVFKRGIRGNSTFPIIGDTAGFPVEISLQGGTGSLSTALSTGEYGTRTDFQLAAPTDVPRLQFCVDHRDFSYDFSLAVASFGGLKALRAKLRPAQGPQSSVVNLQLGYQLISKDPTPR